MYVQHRRRSKAGLIAPLLAATLTVSTADAHGGQRAKCPCPQSPIVVPCQPYQLDPYDPEVSAHPQYAPSIDGVQPMPSVPQATSPSDISSSPVLPQEITEPSMDSEFNDFDLSTGLATSFGGGGAGSLAFADPGYIESAKIRTRVRVRYDNMQGANAPTRGQFLYPSLGAFGGNGPPFGGGGAIASELDVEELSTYFELAFRDRFSLFIDVPIRWIGPIEFGGTPGFQDGTQRGAGNISTGFRWGWINCPDEHLTLQTRISLPTGEPLRALGNGVTSIDVGLLYDQQLNHRTRFYAELNDWQTLDAGSLDPAVVTPASLINQDANILRGGFGLGYDLVQCGTRCQPKTLTVLAECVTWTVLDGVTTSLDPNNTTVLDATGDTIVNGKYGVRYTNDQNSIYVGYGHNWTSDRWYSDLLRVEWQRTF